MEINLNSNTGMRPEMLDTNAIGAAKGTATASEASRLKANLTIGKEVARLASAEPTANVPEAALTRDDALGKLVNSVFCLSAPPMPFPGG